MRCALIIPALLVLGLRATQAHAQGSCTFTDDNGKTVTLPNCAPPDEKPAAAKKPAASVPGTGNRFPFPGEEPAPSSATPNGTPQTPASPTRHPFPGDEAAPATNSTPLQDAGSSGQAPESKPGQSSDADSSSSSSSSSSSAPSGTGPLSGDDDEAAAKVAAKRRTRLPKAPRQTPDEQEEEDLRVAAYYQSDGNFTGAYMRATDAVKLADDDAYAHLALADAARRLGKLDEAQQHYKRGLALDPPEKQRKAAERALKEMAGGH